MSLTTNQTRSQQTRLTEKLMGTNCGHMYKAMCMARKGDLAIYIGSVKHAAIQSAGHQQVLENHQMKKTVARVSAWMKA